MKLISLLLLTMLLAGCSGQVASPTSSLPANSGINPARTPVSASTSLPPLVPTSSPALPVQPSPTPATPYPVPPRLLAPGGPLANILSAKIEWKDVPPQPYLLLQGSLASNCQDWAVYVNPPDERSVVVVSVAVDTGFNTGSCSEAPVPIQREVLLGPLEPGQYVVYVNTTLVGPLTIK